MRANLKFILMLPCVAWIIGVALAAGALIIIPWGLIILPEFINDEGRLSLRKMNQQGMRNRVDTTTL